MDEIRARLDQNCDQNARSVRGDSLRVAVISNFYPPEARGGAELFAKDLNDELARRGISVEVYTSTRGPARVEYQGDVRVRFFRSVPPAQPLTSEILGYNINPWAGPLSRKLRQAEFDLIHIHNINSSVMMYPLVESLRGPVVCHVHDHWPVCYRGVLHDTWNNLPCVSPRPRCCFNPGFRMVAVPNLILRRKLLQRFEAKVDLFISPSEHMRDTLVKRGFTSTEKIQVLPLGLRTSEVVPGDTRLPSFLFAGRLVGYKNPQLVVRLIARGKLPPEVSFQVFGKGPVQRDIDTFAQREPSLRVGWAPRTKVLREIGRSRGLLVPSLIPENSPLVIYEALACGTPVLCTSMGGGKELVSASQAGFILRPDDLDAWEAALHSLLDADTFERLSERARSFAVAQLDISRCASAVIRRYDGLC